MTLKKKYFNIQVITISFFCIFENSLRHSYRIESCAKFSTTGFCEFEYIWVFIIFFIFLLILQPNELIKSLKLHISIYTTLTSYNSCFPVSMQGMDTIDFELNSILHTIIKPLINHTIHYDYWDSIVLFCWRRIYIQS